MWQAEGMARGWESKAVEEQIEAAEERHRQQIAPRVSPGQLAIERERESLELSRTRILRDLEQASKPGYREYLQRSLEFLDAKIRSLGTGGEKPD